MLQKGLGHLAAPYLLCLLVTRYYLSYHKTIYHLQFQCLQKSLLKTTYHFLLLLVGFDTLTYRKELQLIPYTCGLSLHTSHRQLKQWAREITAAETAFDAQKPLKWSSTPIIFDAEDHPDRTTAVGCLPLLVSPTIHNLRVDKMLVDGGAGLNLISPVVIRRFQIPVETSRKRARSKGSIRGGARRGGRSHYP